LSQSWSRRGSTGCSKSTSTTLVQRIRVQVVTKGCIVGRTDTLTTAALRWSDESDICFVDRTSFKQTVYWIKSGINEHLYRKTKRKYIIERDFMCSGTVCPAAPIVDEPPYMYSSYTNSYCNSRKINEMTIQYNHKRFNRFNSLTVALTKC